MDSNEFFFESSNEDLRYETRNLFRGGTDTLRQDLCVHRSYSEEEELGLSLSRQEGCCREEPEEPELVLLGDEVRGTLAGGESESARLYRLLVRDD